MLRLRRRVCLRSRLSEVPSRSPAHRVGTFFPRGSGNDESSDRGRSPSALPGQQSASGRAGTGWWGCLYRHRPCPRAAPLRRPSPLKPRERPESLKGGGAPSPGIARTRRPQHSRPSVLQHKSVDGVGQPAHRASLAGQPATPHREPDLPHHGTTRRPHESRLQSQSQRQEDGVPPESLTRQFPDDVPEQISARS